MSKHQQRGVALITAIWIMAILLVMVAGFAAMVHSGSEIAQNFGELTQVRWAARAGIYRGQKELTSIIAQPYTSLGGDSQLSINSDDENASFGKVTYQTVIEDEAGKININTASAEVLQTLFSEEVADAIIDWRDTDSTPQSNGAEDDYYTGLSTPYHCKNAPFDTVDELLLVKGVTNDMLNTAMTDDGVKLRDLLTVSSVDSNTDASGEARINIATADKNTLSDALGDIFSSQDIDAIIKQRTSTPFTSPADLLDVPNLSREKVIDAYDKLTVTTDKELRGLVNIDTAPVPVLAALPGMDEATAEAIIQYRKDNGPFESVGHLLDVTQVSNSVFKRIANLLTTRSHIFRIIATAQAMDGIEQTTTCLLRVDGTGEQTTTTILYWRE
ncbi:MAG TPA: helix-hairpin-helix domain-containing protein [Armatimonadota bacterium]|nr:helix-hairpin-helix domain-containing protein [Armatimonadota bacterium]